MNWKTVALWLYRLGYTEAAQSALNGEIRHSGNLRVVWHDIKMFDVLNRRKKANA